MTTMTILYLDGSKLSRDSLPPTCSCGAGALVCVWFALCLVHKAVVILRPQLSGACAQRKNCSL